MKTSLIVALVLLAAGCAQTPEQRAQVVQDTQNRRQCENQASQASGFLPWNDQAAPAFPPSAFAGYAKYRNVLNACLAQAGLR